MHVIGFLTYDDFVNELEVIQGSPKPIPPDVPIIVRIQDYSRTVRATSPPGLSRVEFIIEVAAVYGDDVMICRFKLGGALDFEKEKVEHRRKDVQIAMNLLAADLEGNHEFDVRCGLIASAKESETEATPSRLWHWEKISEEVHLVVGPQMGG